jgi:hypothetical protein
MKVVIELEIGTRAVKTYRSAKKIIGDQVGLVGARHGVSLQIDIPEYGDTGLLTDAQNLTVGLLRVDISGDPTQSGGRLVIDDNHHASRALRDWEEFLACPLPERETRILVRRSME